MATAITFGRAMTAIDADEWNRLVSGAPPFLRHEFLAALETSGCVSERSGWHPCHLTITDAGGDLVAAMPLYAKDHSWGEFVFDWSWADAYQRAGLAYYPKLVSASPFTPATGPRLLVREDADGDRYARLLVQGAIELANRIDASSLHIQFIDEPGVRICEEFDLTVRGDCQFHWHNRDYASFEEFLAGFSSAKRKKVRRERRRIREAGVRFQHLGGRDISEADWADAWRLTRTAFVIRGREPYLDLGFFLQAAENLPDMFRVVFAIASGRRIAAALFFLSEDTLYGRYWGSDDDYHSLHFETCYYQGIDYCIAAGLRRFEPGTQGEHKVSRGFLPVMTRSAHWLSHPQFAAAIDAYVERERAFVDEYMEAVNARTPFRSA